MASILWDLSTEEELGKFKKCCTHGGKRKIANLISEIDDQVKHIFGNKIRKQITGPTWELRTEESCR